LRAITHARVNAPVFVSVVVSVRREDIHKLLLIAIVEKEDGAGDAVAHADELFPRLGRETPKKRKRRKGRGKKSRKIKTTKIKTKTTKKIQQIKEKKKERTTTRTTERVRTKTRRKSIGL